MASRTVAHGTGHQQQHSSEPRRTLRGLGSMGSPHSSPGELWTVQSQESAWPALAVAWHDLSCCKTLLTPTTGVQSQLGQLIQGPRAGSTPGWGAPHSPPPSSCRSH